MGKITPVIMSGGSGTRLWPVSRAGDPKQFHRLGGENTLIQDTALRAAGDLFEPPVVVCNAAHAEAVRTQLAAAGVPPRLVILEPTARNTAPCAVAAAAALPPDALVLLLAADHNIVDPEAFRAAMARGIEAAEAGQLVVFGLKPTRPETGYGYIRAETGEGGVRPVAEFVEKPDAAAAERFVADPAMSWNAGMFLFRAGDFLEEARRLTPEVAEAAEAAVREAKPQHGVLPLGESFTRAPSISLDYAVMEKTDRAVVVPCDLAWSDVGAWRALWELGEAGPGRNALDGDVIALDATGCLARSDGPTIALSGVEDLVVVAHKGAVLVARRDDPAAVKRLVEHLKAEGREDLL